MHKMRGAIFQPIAAHGSAEVFMVLAETINGPGEAGNPQVWPWRRFDGGLTTF